MNSSSNSFNVGCGSGCLTILIGAIVWAVVNSILIVFLWNWLIPDLLGLSKISLLQAIGISFLLGLLRSSSSSDNSSSG
jgi:hypothetical protein